MHKKSNIFYILPCFIIELAATVASPTAVVN